MGIIDLLKKLFQTSKQRRQNELLNMLHDSGVITIEGRKDPIFGQSVLEIEDGVERSVYFHISELFGKAIIYNNFSDIEKELDEQVNLTLYGKEVILGKKNVIQYWKDWIGRYKEPCVGTKYKVRYCCYFERSALEIKPFRAPKMFLLARLKDDKVIDLLLAPNPLQNPMIRYWDLDHEALSFQKDSYLAQQLGEDLIPQPNRMPCMRCGLKSEKMQWYKYHYDTGPLAYDGELSICPNCMETVEFFPTILCNIK